jgi:hypothetical protein
MTDQTGHQSEPDWQELIQALEEAETWVRSQNVCEPSGIVRVETLRLTKLVLAASKAGKDSDALVREFFECVNHAAFWLLLVVCDDDALFVERFCVEPERELKKMDKRGLAARRILMAARGV